MKSEFLQKEGCGRNSLRIRRFASENYVRSDGDGKNPPVAHSSEELVYEIVEAAKSSL